jgi:hypothetical protein
MAPGDRVWLNRSLAAWSLVSRKRLKLPPAPLTTVVAFDARCAFTRPEDPAGQSRWISAPHSGSVGLPDGKTVPARVLSFAAPLGPDRTGFFVMALPSVWKAEGVKSDLGVEAFTTGVLLHEIMHSRQFSYINPTMAELTRRFGLPEGINDDSLQEAFGKDPAYVADYEAERDLLFAAVAASSDAEARALAGQALERMRARRTRWFTGEDAKWAELEEVFLTLEGAGQWAAYAWYTDPKGLGLDAAVTLREVRGGGRWWSQDHGLALFLVADRLVPGWQMRVFADKPTTAGALLALAAGER